MTEVTKSTLTLDPSRIGTSTAVFISEHSGHGREHFSSGWSLTIPMDQIRKYFTDLLNTDGNGKAALTESPGHFAGTITGTHGAIQVNVHGSKDYTEVQIPDAMITPAIIAHIKQTFAGHMYYEPRQEGVYWITIKHYYLDAMGQMQQMEHHRQTDDFDELLNEMYPGINVPAMMKLYSDSKENNLFLTGEPGTGKTCFGKMCLREHAKNIESDIDVIYVKDREILKKDSFWAMMTRHSPDVIFLDDLDDELLPRIEGRNEIVNNVLSFSDGLFDSETKIIITTNQPNSRIDKALIRPGRCFDILSLPQLTGKEAESVWVGKLDQSAASFESIFGKDPVRVSQAAVMSEHARHLKSDEPQYLIDPSISIRKVVEEGADVNHEDGTVNEVAAVNPSLAPAVSTQFSVAPSNTVTVDLSNFDSISTLS